MVYRRRTVPMSDVIPSHATAAGGATASALQHKPQLDALRGVACLLVLLAHLRSVWLFAWIPEIAGVMGVGIFFALSGFLITRILLAARGKPHNLTSFYNRRVARIFPIYYLTILVLWIFWPGDELHWAAGFTFNLQYLATARDYFVVDAAKAIAPPIAHVWSLCVEEHFYWFWPFIVLFAPRATIRWVPFAIMCITPFVAWYGVTRLQTLGFSIDQIEGLLSRITITQLAAISIGAWAAINESWLSRVATFSSSLSLSRTFVAACSLLVVGLAGMLGSSTLVSRIPQSLIPLATHGLWVHLICGGLFLWVLASPSFGNRRLLCLLGTISYGAYLYHLPVYAAFGLVSRDASASIFAGVAALTITIAVAALSFRYFEAPLLRRVREAKPGTGAGTMLAGRYVGVLATAAVGVIAIWNLASGYLSLQPATQHVVSVDPDDIRLVIVGSSHGETAIAPPYLDQSAYNLSFNSQDLWYDCQIVHSALQRLPRLKQVVFCVSVFSFRRNVAHIEGQRWMESLYYYAWGIPSSDYEMTREYNRLVLAGSGRDVERMFSKALLADESERGWNRKQGSKISPELGKKRANQHARHGETRIETNLGYLVEAIQECQKRGIEVILITTPLHGTYYQHIPPGQLSQFYENLATVQQLTGVRHLDFSVDYRFTGADFYDPDHLNVNGAEKLTRILNEELASIPVSTSTTSAND